MEQLALHRVSDPRFMAIDVPVAPRGERRMLCPVDSSLEELMARHLLEVGQRERILAGFEDEHRWRTENRSSSEPGVTYGPGARADIEARADASWCPGAETAEREPDAAIVHCLLDASGADEPYIRWLLGEDSYTFVYLVTPPETARHLPQTIEHAGAKVQMRCFPWIREPVSGRFDPLAASLWFDLAGPEIALRESVSAPLSASFLKKKTRPPSKRGS